MSLPLYRESLFLILRVTSTLCYALLFKVLQQNKKTIWAWCCMPVIQPLEVWDRMVHCKLKVNLGYTQGTSLKTNRPGLRDSSGVGKSSVLLAAQSSVSAPMVGGSIVCDSSPRVIWCLWPLRTSISTFRYANPHISYRTEINLKEIPSNQPTKLNLDDLWAKPQDQQVLFT